MAKATRRFNPAPGWPAPPSPEWLPPAGWQPDPSWPPAPEGWPVVIEPAASQRRMGRRKRVFLIGAPIAAVVGIGVGALAHMPASNDFNVKSSCHDFAKKQIAADPHPEFSGESVKATGHDRKTGLPRYLLSGYVSWVDLSGPHSTRYACEVLIDKHAKKVRLSDLEIAGL